MRFKIRMQCTGVWLARKPAHTILNGFNIRLEHFFGVRGAYEAGSRKYMHEGQRFQGSVSRGEVARRHCATSPLASPPQEQPVKSVRATLVVIAGITFNGLGGVRGAVEVTISDGVQSAFPPFIGAVIGTAALASTLKSTSPLAGAEKVKPPATNIPTLGLLAGTTSVYCAQFAPVGLPIGQFLLSVMEIRPVDVTAEVIAVACVFWSGMVNCRVTLEDTLMVCRAARVTSAVAPAVAVLAVTKPCKIAGPAAPVSATSGMMFRFVPFGTFTTAVALYGRFAAPSATTTMSNVPVGSGQKRKFPFESAAACMTMRSMPMLSVRSSAPMTLPDIGFLVTGSTTSPPVPQLLRL